MLTTNAPAPNALNGQTLRDELATAGIVVNETALTYVPGNPPRLEFSELEEADRATVERVIAAHVPPPPPPTPEDRLAQFHAAVDSATTIADLKRVLKGETGPGVDPRPR